MSGDSPSIIASPELFKNSYNLLFTEQIPEVLFYQRDRPHYYNLVLKLIALLILIAVIVPLTILPVYPFISVLLTNNFRLSKTFGGGTGTMNLHWIGLLYLFYIFHMTNTIGGASSGSGSVSDGAGGGIYIGLFMALTPIALLLTWYYAMPVTIHNAFVEIYNSIYGTHPLLPGGIAYSTMRCPSDVQTRLAECLKAPATEGGGIGDAFNIMGMGLTDMIIVALVGIVLTLVIAYVWSYRLDTLTNDTLKLNTDERRNVRNTVVIPKE
jgi:hypothetical protein